MYYNTCKEQENKTSNKNEGENKMKEYKVRYMWNGKIFAEPVMGTSLWDATITFIEQLYADTNSWERCKAGFKICNNK